MRAVQDVKRSVRRKLDLHPALGLLQQRRVADQLAKLLGAIIAGDVPGHGI
jgi:hypothetical protein